MEFPTTVGERRFFRGFTLIELLVVLAIVAVLLALALPRSFNQIDASREVVLRENLRLVRDVLDKYYSDVGNYPNSIQDLVDKKYIMAAPYDPITESDQDWIVESPPDGYKGVIYNIRSSSDLVGRNGVVYSRW